MYNNFELNETTGVGLIKGDNDNNILIKTNANEEQLTSILEKENEIENEQNKIDRIKKLINSYNDIMLTKKIFYFMSAIIGTFAYIAYRSSIVNQFLNGINKLNKVLSFALLVVGLECLYLSTKLGTFKYNLNQRKKLEESIEEPEEKIKKLKEELESLKSEVQIEEMNPKEVETFVINYPKRSEEEKNNDYVNVQSGPVKFKSLRKEFEK